MILDLTYTTFSCGNFTNLPAPIANLIYYVINIAKLLVPIIIICVGIFELTVAITKQKEDDMKQAQKIFVKRLISGVLVFFVVAIVQLVFGLVARASGDNSVLSCFSCFVNGVNESGECR